MTATLVRQEAPLSAAPLRRRRRPRPGLVLLGLLVAAVVTVHLVGIGRFPAFSEDEGTYYSQAWAVQHLASLSPWTYWYDHPPLGWVQLSAFTWLTDLLVPVDARSAILSGRLVMVGCTAVTAVLVYLLGRRLRLRPGFAALAMVLWGLSPLAVVEGRQVFLDNLALPWLVGAFVLAAGRRRDLWHYTAAGVCLGIAVLTKETLLVAAPALLVVVWHYSYKPTRAFGLVGAVTALVLTGASYVLFAALRDELLPGAGHVSLWDALTFQLGGRASTGAVWSAGTPAHDLLTSWLSLDPVLLVAGGLAALVCLLRWRLRALGVVLGLFMLTALRPGGYLPSMFVVALLPFAAVAVAAVLDLGWTVVRRRDTGGARERWAWRPAYAAVLAVALALTAAGWQPHLRQQLTGDATATHAQVLDYVAAHVPTKDVVVTDNSYWNDLVDRGWDPATGVAVWFYKVDTDPVFDQRHPGGWRDVDYLVWTSVVADDPAARTGDLAAAYRHSRVVRSWGSGADRVQLREVEHGTTR